jgi:hypothetical protein
VWLQKALQRVWGKRRNKTLLKIIDIGVTRFSVHHANTDELGLHMETIQHSPFCSQVYCNSPHMYGHFLTSICNHQPFASNIWYQAFHLFSPKEQMQQHVLKIMPLHWPLFFLSSMAYQQLMSVWKTLCLTLCFMCRNPTPPTTLQLHHSCCWIPCSWCGLWLSN